MFAQSKTKKLANENVFIDFLKGLILAVVISFALIIVFALLLGWLNLSDTWIVPVTLVIKGLSVLFGSMVAVKGSKGLIKGGLFGAIYVVVAFVVFGLLAGGVSFDIGLVLDFAFAVLLGALVGIVKVNRA